MDCYVRIHCPKSGDGFTGNIGHYDLIFDAEIDMKSFYGDSVSEKKYLRPVFSFGGSGVLIAPLNNIDEKYAEAGNYNVAANDYYQWHFTVTEDKVWSFLVVLKALAGTINAQDSSISFWPTNHFSEYVLETKNCFVATSVWMEMLGVNDLADIVDKATYMRYSPYLMKRLNKNYWTKVHG